MALAPWDDLDDDGDDDGYSRAAWIAGISQGPTLDELLARCRPGWFARASCAGLDPALFFPAPGDPGDEAKAVCSDCPVRAPCARLAADRSEAHGVWGGLGPRERKRNVHAR